MFQVKITSIWTLTDVSAKSCFKNGMIYLFSVCFLEKVVKCILLVNVKVSIVYLLSDIFEIQLLLFKCLTTISFEYQSTCDFFLDQQTALNNSNTKRASGKGVGDPYKCEVCDIFLNSQIQLGQHLSSAKHKERAELQNIAGIAQGEWCSAYRSSHRRCSASCLQLN